MNLEGVFPKQLGTEDLDKMVRVALADDVIQSLLKTGEYVTQVSYLSLAFPDDDWTTPEVVAGLPVFFGHLPPAELAVRVLHYDSQKALQLPASSVATAEEAWCMHS